MGFKYLYCQLLNRLQDIGLFFMFSPLILCAAQKYYLLCLTHVPKMCNGDFLLYSTPFLDVNKAALFHANLGLHIPNTITYAIRTQKMVVNDSVPLSTHLNR